MKTEIQELLKPHLFKACKTCKYYVEGDCCYTDLSEKNFCPCGKQTVIEIVHVKDHCMGCGELRPVVRVRCSTPPGWFNTPFGEGNTQHFMAEDNFLGNYV